DRYGVRGTVSGPINDQIGFRLSGIWDDQGTGYTKNLLAGAPNKTLEAKTIKGGHINLTYQPVERLKLELDGMYLDTQSTNLFAAFGPTNTPALVPVLGAQTFAPHQVYSSYPAMFNSDYGQISLTATLDITK